MVADRKVQNQPLFAERLVPAKEGSGKLFETELVPPSGLVECLGMTFENDDARREYFLGRLREALEELHAKLGGVPFTTIDEVVQLLKSVKHWPMGSDERLRVLAERMREGYRKDKSKDVLQLWKDQVGFPHGDIADILRLSDPPYYTACPNPFLADFVRYHGTSYDPNVEYRREPLAKDVSVGKTDPIYRAHSYHTKVPHLAIVPYILHYTEPGDIILDGFAGSGMTGVAAQWCGSAPEDYKRTLESEWQAAGRGKPKWGARRVILGDLSPAATFIAANYNLPFDAETFEKAARQILDEVEQELGWMYETLHTDGKTKGRIEYTVWSEVFACPDCSSEIVFLEHALDPETKRVRDAFPCPECGAELTKHSLERVFDTRVDPVLGRPWKRIRFEPVFISYRVDKHRFEKPLDDLDRQVLEKISNLPYPSGVPSSRFPVEQMYHGSRIAPKGLTHVHHFFLPRAIHALHSMWRKAKDWPDWRIRNMLLFFVEQAIWGMAVLNRYQPIQHGRPGGSQVNRQMTGVYYVASQIAEVSPSYNLEGRVKRLVKAFKAPWTEAGTTWVTTSTASWLDLPSDSIDYILTDPPFGENIYYADLNFLIESWHRVHTNAAPEAIIDRAKQKGLLEYQYLMQQCFEEYYRVLKPGRWMTVVFHNSWNAVWNAIQEALQAAGFVVADVRTMDKKQGSYRQVTSSAAKQDLVISAYKPNDGLEERFKLTAGTEEGVWDFVRSHLKQLPVFVAQDGKVEVLAERQSYMLYDRMVAFHVQRGVLVPMSAAEFYAGLDQRFPKRDDMYFLPEQVAEYEKKRMTVEEIQQLELFVTDEASAIQWLRQQLSKKPQTFQELHPQFMREIGGWQKHEKPLELLELLEQNFLKYDGTGEVPSQIHGYLSSNFKDLRNLPKDDERLRAKAKDRWYVPDPNKAVDLEKLRERALLREFEEYRESKQKRLRVFRLEAVRAGFKKAWQERDYETIISVADKIPANILQEDAKLLMWYDQALTRLGRNA